MEHGHEDAVVLLMEEGLVSYSSSSTCQCRICHEEEDQSFTSMESPCACCGTLKFAHRGCIQRWCDEKGSTFCEICLQEFGPGYSVAPKKALLDAGATIRGSLVVHRQEHETQSSSEEDVVEMDYAECSETSTRSMMYFRSIVVMFTILLLFRHLISVIALEAKHQPLTLFTVFALRASGILLPIYFIMRMVSAVQNLQTQCHQPHQVHSVTRRASHV